MKIAENHGGMLTQLLLFHLLFAPTIYQINSIHYENMSVQYEAISKSGKNDILDVKM